MREKMEQVEIDRIAKTFFALFLEQSALPDIAARCCKLGRSILISDIEENPSYWLVPAACNQRLVGFIRLGLEGKLMAYGRFGQGPQLSDLPLLSFLSEEVAGREIRRSFGSDYGELTPPKLVHDGPVDRITWLSRGRSGDGKKVLLFWSFGTTYLRTEPVQRSSSS